MVANPRATENLLRPRHFVEVLGTDWPFRAVTIVPYLLATLLPTTASELSRLAEPSLLVALGVASLSVTVLGTLVLVAGILLPRRARRSPIVVILVLMCLGAIRGVIVSLVVDQSGLEAHSHLTSRIVLAALSLPPVLSLISVVISRIVLSRERSVATQAEIVETQRNRDRVLSEIRKSDELLLHEVDESLRPAIEKIRTDVRSGRGKRSAIASALDHLADNIVRPLSHVLATSRSDSAAIRAPITRAFEPPGVPTVREQVNAGFVGLGVFLGSGTVLVDLLNPIQALIAALASGAMVYLIVRGVTALFARQRWSYRRTALFIISLYSWVWIPPHLVNLALVFPPDWTFEPSVVSIIATPVVGLLYLLVVRGAYSTRNQLVRLENTRLEVALQLSEARRRAWLRQKHMTHTLHSSIQSRIHAEARLIREGKGPLSPAESTRVLESLDSVFASINDEPPPARDAIRGIEDMAEFWRGMCDIELNADERVVEVAASDPEVAEAIQVVSLEMISNAIRHGRATRLMIRIERDTPETIRIVATNNGDPVVTNGKSGLGTTLYDELTAEWTIDNDDTGTVTIVAVIAARGNTLVA